MELQEAISKKDKLESDITKLIVEFQKATGLKVSDVDFFIPVMFTGTPPAEYHFSFVTVKVEI